MKITFLIFSSMILLQIQCQHVLPMRKMTALRHCTDRCPQNDDTVCGKDHKKYKNMCYLECAKVELKHTGGCAIAENCPRGVKCQPLCGKDKKWYCSDCYLEAAGTTLAYPGLCINCKEPAPKDDNEKVCGVNNKTYKNLYHLICKAKVEWKSSGECPPVKPRPTFCILVYKPVCGTDKKTYSNSCFAGVAGVGILYEGPCLDCKKKCPSEYLPVCGADGYTRKNVCELICKYKHKYKSEGACPRNEDCMCPMHVKPVCGVDGKPYSNSCVAHCERMSTQAMKYCKKPSNYRERDDDKDDDVKIGSTRYDD